MGGKTWIRAGRLDDELDRLSEQYQGNPDALQVVDAVRCWLAEETVLDADDVLELVTAETQYGGEPDDDMDY